MKKKKTQKNIEQKAKQRGSKNVFDLLYASDSSGIEFSV